MERPVQRFLSDAGKYVVSEGVPAIIGLLSLVVFTRVFPPSSFGRYALVLTIVNVGSILLYGWLEQAILRYEAVEGDRLVETANRVVLVLSAFLFGAGVVLYPLVSGNLGHYESFYWAALALLILEGVFLTTKTVYKARLSSSLVTKLEVGRSVSKFLLALVLALVVFGDIVGWVWGSALSALLLVAVVITRNPLAIGDEIDRSMLWSLLRFGLPLIGWLLGYTLLEFSDRLILEFYRSSTAVGVYASNYSLASRALMLIYAPIVQSAHPIVMRVWSDEGDNTEARSLITQFTRYMLLVGVPATAGISLLAYPLSNLVFEPAYAEAGLVIPFIAVGIFAWNLGMVGHKGLEITEQTHLLLGGVAVSVVVNLGLNVALVPFFGYRGAAIATMIGFVCYPIFVYVVTSGSLKWRLPKSSMRNAVAATVVMCGLYGGLFVVDLFTTPVVLGVVPLAAIIYAVGLYAFGEFTPNELARTREFIEE